MLRSVAQTKNTRDGSGTRRVGSEQHHALSTKRDDVHPLPAISKVQHQYAISSGQCVDGKVTQDEDHPQTPTRFCGHSYCEPVLSSAACSPRSPRRPWRSTPQTSSSIRIVRAGQRRDVEKPRNRIAFARGLVHVSHTQHDYLDMLRAGELDRDQKRKKLLDACAEEHFVKRFEWLNIQV